MRTKKELIGVALAEVGSSREFYSANDYLEAVIDELEELHVGDVEESKLVTDLQYTVQQCLNVLRKEV